MSVNNHSQLANEQLLDIDAAANHAYQRIAQERQLDPDEVHRTGVCHQAASLMVASLLESGHDVERRTGSSPWVIEGHCYVEIRNGGAEALIIDPTWQQFLKGNIPDNTPRVLVGSSSKVVERAISLGVNPSIAKIWTSGES